VLQLCGYRYCGVVSWKQCKIEFKGKVLPYSLPSAGPEADPGVQAVLSQVTF